MKLAGKTAIITGGAAGIGRSIARRFSEEGAYVALADIDIELAGIAAENLQGEAFQCNIRNSMEIKNLVTELIDRRGSIDILVNNAAIAIPGNILEMPEEDWNLVIDTNLNGAYRFIREVLPQMIKQGAGSIINICSAQAWRSWPDWTAYSAAKGGLISMTRQLAGQFGSQNIRVNSISPGTISTPMLEERLKNEGSELLIRSQKMHAMERIGQPEEVAALALLLASDDAAFINGSDIKIDGGLSTLPRYL